MTIQAKSLLGVLYTFPNLTFGFLRGFKLIAAPWWGLASGDNTKTLNLMTFSH